MRILVCGSRHFDDYDYLESILDKEDVTYIISGGAKGADTLAEHYALIHNKSIRVYMAQWDLHGKAAGPIRNKEMLDKGKPDLVIAFLAPNSRGTKNMIERAEERNIPVKIINIG